MPGSPAPALCSRDCKPIRLLPLPAPPVKSVMRPAGRPPRNTSSSPTMPVGTFWIAFLRSCCPDGSLCFTFRVRVATAGLLLFYDSRLDTHRQLLWKITHLTFCQIQTSNYRTLQI